MAMEQLEVPSRSYIIRWVDCAPGNTIHWSIKPHKKSLNFGLFRHPGGSGGSNSWASERPPSTARSEESSTSTIKETRPKPSRTRNTEGDAIDKIHAAGLLDIYWHGKCEAERVTTGTYQVKSPGGMFALVFDNTFSKQLAKTATFVLLTYPSNQPPPASHALNHADTQVGIAITNTLTRSSLASPSAQSTEALSIYSHNDGYRDDAAASTPGFQTGVLKKRKRKRHQGYARRYFSLDFTSSTLSYYLNRESSALRGAIPLSLAAISASKKDREICIDSGAEVWHLRANNDRDWETWKTALERAATLAAKASTGDRNALRVPEVHTAPGVVDSRHVIMEERGWAGVEALVGRVAGVRDAVRRLAFQAAEAPTLAGMSGSEAASSSNSIVSQDSQDRAGKRTFWKRKAPSPAALPLVGPTRDRQKSVSAAVGMLTPAAVGVGRPFSPKDEQQHDISANLHALLADLDSVVEDFSSLVSQNKQRRWLHHRTSTHQPMNHSPSRMSMESTASDEFFDAEDVFEEGDRVVMLNNEDDDGDGAEESATEGDATDDDESDPEDDSYEETPQTTPGSLVLPLKPKRGGKRDLKPLPLERALRRKTVPEAKQLPPSLIGFLRKNVGKDLSTIAMPVSANEPLSLLQRAAEQLEYSELLDKAVTVPAETGERILLIAAFAISSFSGVRIKERAIRKPFNPMLGETFELVREDKGFRFLAEKVCHRPVVMACHADSATWTFSQSPQPTQKFWGKSAELITSGRVRIYFPASNDRFSYTVATSFLRNIIAGEKYVEPTGSMHIHNETTGDKAVVTFKQNKGMFSGRSEEVSVQAFDADGGVYPCSLAGKWTEHLLLFEASNPDQPREIWQAGTVVDGAQTRYGFPLFTAQLNEITPIEKGALPPTDSRLRPDQRMVENGLLDDAEEVKGRLEEAQRSRRREMEEAGESWTPRWFRKVREYADEEVWTIVGDEEEEGEYWKVREKGTWAEETGRAGAIFML